MKISTQLKPELDKTRIVLGTANLGMKYGLSKFQIEKKNFYKVIEFALSEGIVEVDTADDYNNYQILSDVISNNIDSLKFNSKINFYLSNNVKKDISIIEKKIDKMPFIPDIIFIHNQVFFDQTEQYLNFKSEFDHHFKNIKLGISLYDKHYFLNYKSKDKNLIFQHPLNPLIENLTIFNDKNKINYVRSIFLQGLLLQDLSNTNIHPILQKIKKKFFYEVDKHKIDKFEYLVNFAYQNSNNSKIIVGFDSLKHLKKFINTKYTDIPKINIKLTDLEKFYCDPRNWN